VVETVTLDDIRTLVRSYLAGKAHVIGLVSNAATAVDEKTLLGGPR